MAKTDPAFKTRDWSGLVCKRVSLYNIDFSSIVHIYFKLRFYRGNYFCSSQAENIQVDSRL